MRPPGGAQLFLHTETACRHSAFVCRPRLAGLALSLLLAACRIGPTYHRPTFQPPASYKEAVGWKVAQPRDAVIREHWWELFNDPDLNALEQKVNLNNQNIAASFAAFEAARAVVREARSQYFPTVSISPAAQVGRLRVDPRSASGTYSTFTLPLDASWAPDLWGRIRNNVAQNEAAAQISAADLENQRLLQHAALAIDYFGVSGQDALLQLYASTVRVYQESLALAQARYETGVDSEEAVAQAETQLKTVQAEATNLSVLRAQYEHAIAMLIGQPASSFSLSARPFSINPPELPLGVPSQLLERRPDIAAAERAVAQANAQIGLAETAYYPTLSLTGAAGFQTTSLTNLFSTSSFFWSLGGTLAETIFEGGLRRATVEQFEAVYKETVASYRQTVLVAFQQVEDDLSTLRLLAIQLQQQEEAVKSAQHFLQLATDRYRLGIDPYLNVVTAESTVLSNQQTALSLRIQQLIVSVQLIEVLGGGWDSSRLPSSGEVSEKEPPER